MENKILRIVQRYLAAERSRERRQITRSKRFPTVGQPSATHKRQGIDAKSATDFERAARVCSTNTLVCEASAAEVPVVPSFVAGRLLSEDGRCGADRLGSAAQRDARATF
jgi:hypothetical protein